MTDSIFLISPGAFVEPERGGDVCPWCGLRKGQEDEHGIEKDRDDGGIDIFCRVKWIVVYPKKLGRIDGITT